MDDNDSPPSIRLSDFEDSPYRAPEATVGGGARRPVIDSGSAERIDPAAALKYPFSSPDWLSTAVLMGLIYLVPIVGILAVFGWMQRIFDEVRASEARGLPSVDFGGDISRGARVFGSFLIGTFGLMAVIGLVVGVLIALGTAVQYVAGEEAVGAVVVFSMVAQMFGMLVIFALYPLMPELIRRAHEGDLWAWFRWISAVKTILASPLAYLTVLAGMMAALMMSYAGLLACYFGIFLTLPLALAAVAHLLGQWSRHLTHLGVHDAST